MKIRSSQLHDKTILTPSSFFTGQLPDHQLPKRIPYLFLLIYLKGVGVSNLGKLLSVVTVFTLNQNLIITEIVPSHIPLSKEQYLNSNYPFKTESQNNPTTTKKVNSEIVNHLKNRCDQSNAFPRRVGNSGQRANPLSWGVVLI